MCIRDRKCAARVLTRMKNSTAAALHDTLGGYTGVQTLPEQLDPRTREPHYALLPVWMLHTRWKEQDFLFAMNGQTGKLIGDLPVAKGRVAAWFAGIKMCIRDRFSSSLQDVDVLTGQSLVQAADGAELAAHGAGVAVVVLGQAGVTDGLCL